MSILAKTFEDTLAKSQIRQARLATCQLQHIKRFINHCTLLMLGFKFLP